MGYINGELGSHDSTTGIQGPPGAAGPPGPQGPPGENGIGYKLTVNGNYDLDKKLIRNLECPIVDVADDSDYDNYTKDLKTGINKQYVNEHFLKKKGYDFDLKQSTIKNAEPYNDSTYDDHTLVPKEYVDAENSKQDIAINSNSQLIGNITSEISKKADLSKKNTQIFTGRIQVPDFEDNNHHMSDVANLKYIIGNYLNKNTGGVLDKSIQFNTSNSNDDRQLFGLGTPKYNSSAVSKSYVDNKVASGSIDDTKFLYIDGSRLMTGDLDMNGNKIVKLKDPVDAEDAVTKHYMESHVSQSHVTSSDKTNVFKYVMDDHYNQLSEEDDVELKDLTTVVSSPHKINKKMVRTQLIYDNNWKRYSSRIGINIFSLPNDNYTMAFELLCDFSQIDMDKTSLDCLSSIETVHKKSFKIFDNYVKMVVQFNKNTSLGNNYLMIDINMEVKPGQLYPPKLLVYFDIYGIKGLQSDVPSSVYDALWTVGIGKVIMNKVIDMGDKAIIGIEKSSNPTSAINLQQFQSVEEDVRILQRGIEYKQEVDWYYSSFEYYFDCLDPNAFYISDSSAVITSIQNKLIPGRQLALFDFDVKNGLNLYSSQILLDKIYNHNDNFTLFITFKHDTDITRSRQYLAFASTLDPILGIHHFPPYLRIDKDYFYLMKPKETQTRKQIPLSYKNKQIMLWFTKKGSSYKIKLCANSDMIEETVSSNSFQANILLIHFDYFIQRIGFSPRVIDIGQDVFNKILFMEKSRGTHFQ